MCQRLGLDGIRGLFASQPGPFSIQSCDNRGQPLHPICGQFIGGESHLLSILVPEEMFSQRPVEALHDALVHVDVNPTAPNMDRLLCQQLTDGAHELAPRVTLKELRPPLRARPLATSAAVLLVKGSAFVASGNVNNRESKTKCFPPYAVVWQKEQIGLMDLVYYRHVKFRPWYVPWSRQIDLPDGLLLEPVLGLLLSHLCCRRQLFKALSPF